MFCEMTLVVRLKTMLDQLHTEDMPFSVPCFNIRLRWAANLYNTPGRWDISKDCVLTIRDMTVKILHLFMPFAYKYMLTFVESPALRRFYWRLEPVLAKLELYWQQMFVYPPFERFLPVTEERSRDTGDSNETVVSCRGLQGTPAEIKQTYLTLVHLIMATDLITADLQNSIEDSFRFVYSYPMYIFFSYVPQCYIDKVI